MAERYLLGIDGGGTRTRAVLATTGGKVLGYGEGGSGNYRIAGLHIAKESLRAAINGAFAAANLSVQDVEVATLAWPAWA
jgi:N-acetylglucosamine kinase-like BadF-type ATPase